MNALLSWLPAFTGGFVAADNVPDVARDPNDAHWWSEFPGNVARLWPANARTARRLPVVDNCVSVLAQNIATLPGGVFERMPDGSRREVSDHPLKDVLCANPNDDDTAFELRGTMQDDASLHGNALAEIVPTMRGAVGALRHIPQAAVRRIYRGRDRVRWYEVLGDANGVRRLRQDEVFHLRALPIVGEKGTAPLDRASGAISNAMALQDYAARFFDNNAQSGGVITAPAKFPSDEARDQFLDKWNRARRRSMAHSDALLEFGMTYTPGQVNNEQAQFLETRKELNLELARYWNMPPHKVGILDNAHHTNIEHEGIAFVTDTMLPWVEMWEQRINKDLVINPRFYFEFNLDGLLRGDLKARYEAFKMGRDGGWLSVNEIRKMLNRDPVEGGDEYLEPLNMKRVGDNSDTDKGAA